MLVAPRLNVSAAVLLTALCASPQAHASPPATAELVAAGDAGGAESARAVDETGTTGTTGAGPTDTAKADMEMAVDGPTTLDPGALVKRHEVQQRHAMQHAVPLPTRRRGFGDKRLRHDRGMLAAGILFTAICGAGAGLSVWAIVEQPRRVYSHRTSDGVAAVTGLLTCTVGALALAATGAARLKKRRGR
jgi:hypothetical protein